MEINENKAQVLNVETQESFQAVKKRLQRDNARKIAFDGGKPIELNQESAYSVLLVQLKDDVLTESEFNALEPYLMGGIVQAIQAGVVAPDRIQQIATAFSIPKQPPFPYDFPDGAGVTCYWEGTTTYRYEWKAPPVEEEPEPEETEPDE